VGLAGVLQVSYGFTGACVYTYVVLASVAGTALSVTACAAAKKLANGAGSV
jgi:hypothetical protein